MRLYSLFFLLLICGFTYSQTNLKCKWIYPASGSNLLDTLIIERTSISVIPKVTFDFDSKAQTLFIDSDRDSVLVCYRTLHPDVFPTLQFRDISQYEPSRLPTKVSTVKQTEPLFDFGSDIQKSGFISRGVTFGNRQNLFVNSTLNLQIHGKISDSMNIEAVITDQNIPYQPEGNTQQIRDFDNVYIKLFNDKFDLTAGDIVFQNPLEKRYFLKYYKNVQGVQFNYQSEIGKWKGQMSVATAASKGKFASIELEAVEGVQGPYVLRGPNGERFIIVLANSEKVFLDGKLLSRGFDRDYTIDYNLGQVTFNSHILITQFSVLRVDFEYAEQYYARTSSVVSQFLSNGKTELRFSYYGEKDNNSGSFGFQPSADDLEELRSIGDDLSLAQVSGTDSVGFNFDQILYKRVDSVDLDGITQTIFIRSINPDSAFFSVNFSEVGFGSGNYVLLESTANGQIFEWVSPQSGIAQGNYEPTRQVPLPISKQMMTMGFTHQLNPYESFSQEIGISTVDQNLYSNIDDSDNTGLAWHGSITSKGRVIGRDYKLNSSLMWELDQAEFRPMDRYRPILFDRDWDYDPDGSSASDLIISWNSAIEKDKHHSLSYQMTRRDREGQIDGWQHGFDLKQKISNVYLDTETFLLTNVFSDLNSQWIRNSTDVSLRAGKVIPGCTFTLDQNELTRTDSIVSSRMHFTSHEFYLTNSDSSETQFRLSYERRTDRLPVFGRMEEFTNAENFQGRLARKFGYQDINLIGTYRKVSDKINDTNDEWLNARMLWNGKLLNENLSHRLSYQIGNVRELRRDFIYVLVGGTQGTHAWRDENNDGIKDLNEFYEAVNIDERQYAKFFTPTDEFIEAFETKYQHTINGRFPTSWRTKGGVRQFLSKWKVQASMTVHFKTDARNVGDRLNPFGINPAHGNMLFASNRTAYSANYNQSGSGLGWEGSFTRSERKQLLSNGFELVERHLWNSVTKWQFNREYSFHLNNHWGSHVNSSDFLENRNVDIHSFGYGLEFIWQPSNSVRLTTGLDIRSQEDTFDDMPNKANIQEVFGTFVWNQSRKGILNANLRWVKIDFDGEENTFSAYQLLEALRPGQNTTWRFNWQQTLRKEIQATIQYNGRTSEGQAPIHTGTVIMTAFF